MLLHKHIAAMRHPREYILRYEYSLEEAPAFVRRVIRREEIAPVIIRDNSPNNERLQYYKNINHLRLHAANNNLILKFD